MPLGLMGTATGALARAVFEDTERCELVHAEVGAGDRHTFGLRLEELNESVHLILIHDSLLPSLSNEEVAVAALISHFNILVLRFGIWGIVPFLLFRSRLQEAVHERLEERLDRWHEVGRRI